MDYQSPLKNKVIFLATQPSFPSNRERSNKRGLDPTCRLCGEEIGSSQHCLWSCVHAQEIWKRSLRILARNEGYGEVSWVVAQWLTTDQESWFLQFNELGPFMQLERGTIGTTNSPSQLQTKSIELKSLWTILASLRTTFVMGSSKGSPYHQQR